MHSDSKKRRSFLALLFAAGDVRRSTDGVRGILSYSYFGFMVKSVVAEGSSRCSPQGVGNHAWSRQAGD